MLEELFNSKIRAKLFSLFFKQPEKKYYIQEIVRLIKSDPANTYRELEKLVKLEVLVSEKVGNLKYFTPNSQSKFFEGMRKLVEAQGDIDENDWFMFEAMPQYTPSAVYHVLSVCLANRHFERNGIKFRFSKIITTYKENVCEMWLLRKEFDELVSEVMDYIMNNPRFIIDYLSSLRSNINSLMTKVNELDKMNLASLTNEQLYKIYDEYMNDYLNVHDFAWVQSGVDFGDNLLSKYLLNYLKEVMEKNKINDVLVGDAFSVLTTPLEKGSISNEYEDILNILKYIQSKSEIETYFKQTETRIIVENLLSIDAQIYQQIQKHTKEYGWLGYGMLGPSWNLSYFIDILCSLARQGINPGENLKKMELDNSNLIKKQENLIKDLQIDEIHQNMFKVARELVYTKGLRKDAMFYFFSVIENAYREIGRRFYLSLNQVRFMYPFEIKELLLKGKINLDKINIRSKFSFRLSQGTFSKDILIDGENASAAYDEYNLRYQETGELKELLGDCACPGRIKGQVKVINITKDMYKMGEGNILVSIATTPDLVPAIKKAGAIITDMGGITCHAAIISRELGIPCIIGTKNATRVLKDGDIIDADATHGRITILEKG